MKAYEDPGWIAEKNKNNGEKKKPKSCLTNIPLKTIEAEPH